MRSQSLIFFRESFKDFIRNPILAIPTAILLIFFTLFSKLSVSVNYKFTQTPAITAWLVFFVVISLCVMSFLFSSLIGMSKESIGKKASSRSFLFYGKKFWMKNFVIIVLILAVYNAIRFAAHYSAFYIGKAISLDVNAAKILFFIIFFVGLAGILIFLAFSSFFLIVYNLSIKQSINSSFSYVSKNYPLVLSLTILFFIINESLSKINYPLIVDIINSLIIVPYISLIFTRLMYKK